MIGIYKITNKINGKVYIGLSRNIRHRWLEQHKPALNHCYHYNSHLQNAWNEYGKDNFLFEIIEECEESKLNEREIYWIAYYHAADRRFGYNVQDGGQSKASSLETRQKISKNNARYWLGKKQSEKTKQKRRLSMLGQKRSEETKLKQHLASVGKKKSKEHCKNISLANIKRFSDPQKRLEQAERTRMFAKEHPYCLINNGMINKRINLKLLKEYLDKGWKRGRLPIKH